MNIFVVGMNYKVAKVEIREKLNFREEEYEPVLRQLKLLPQVAECVLLSTCNRTEVYLFTQTDAFDSSCVEELLCNIKRLDAYALKKYFYFYKGTKAVRHIFNVACGMDSSTLFEDQILGQFKNAHDISMKAGTASGVLNTLCKQAITSAKRIQTYKGSYCISVPDIAVKIIEKVFGGEIQNKRALVIGTGSIGSAVIQKLADIGVQKIYVTKRTHSKGECLPDNEKITVIDYTNRYAVLDTCDIIISSTTSPHYTITKDVLENSMNHNKARLFIDLAVPRDIDITIKQLPNIRYYNIDDMKTDERCEIAGEDYLISFTEETINENIFEFKKWFEFRDVMPLVKDIQSFAEGIVQEKAAYAFTKLNLPDENKKEIIKASISDAVNRIVDRLVYSTREFENKAEREIYLRVLRDIINKN